VTVDGATARATVAGNVGCGRHGARDGAVPDRSLEGCADPARPIARRSPSLRNERPRRGWLESRRDERGRFGRRPSAAASSDGRSRRLGRQKRHGRQRDARPAEGQFDRNVGEGDPARGRSMVGSRSRLRRHAVDHGGLMSPWSANVWRAAGLPAATSHDAGTIEVGCVIPGPRRCGSPRTSMTGANFGARPARCGRRARPASAPPPAGAGSSLPPIGAPDVIPMGDSDG
jgi:hypothetical protein